MSDINTITGKTIMDYDLVICVILVYAAAIELFFFLPLGYYSKKYLFRDITDVAKQHPLTKTDIKRFKKMEKYRCLIQHSSMHNGKSPYGCFIRFINDGIFIEIKWPYLHKSIYAFLPMKELRESGCIRISKFYCFTFCIEDCECILIRTICNDSIRIYVPKNIWILCKCPTSFHDDDPFSES